MKFPLLLTIIGLLTSSFADETRVWTSKDGKKVTAELVDRTDTKISIKNKDGKIFWIEKSKLSDVDVKFAEEFEFPEKPKWTIRTVKATTKDERKLEISVTGIREGEYVAHVLWLGPKGNTVDVDATHKVTINENKSYFDSYDSDNYKGWVVGIYNKDGGIIHAEASQKPFKRFVIIE